jgi:hypothetical protein
MLGTLFGRVTATGLVVALIVGCGPTEQNRPHEVNPGPTGEVTAVPNSPVPNSVTPKPVAPLPATPKPVVPDPDEMRVGWVPPGPDPPIKRFGGDQKADEQ